MQNSPPNAFFPALAQRWVREYNASDQTKATLWGKLIADPLAALFVATIIAVSSG